jgi:hypothetical protein
MHDPNFEKTVQQKMEELQFHPAESVWVNIEKAVAGQRHRRGLPYFWRFALPVILAAAVTGGYYLTTTTRSADKAVSAQGVSRQPVAASSVSGGESTQAASGAPAATGSLSTPLAVSEGKAAAKATDPTRYAAASKSFSGTTFSGTTFSGRREKGTRRSGSSLIAGDRSLTDASAVKTKRSGVTQGGEEAAAPGVSMTATSAQSAATTATPAQSAARKAWFYQPGLADQRQTQAIRAAQLNNKKTAIAIASLQKKVRPWEAGFVAGGGISRLNRLNGAQAAAAVSFTAASFYRINGSSQGNAYISDVRSDAAFSGGVYLQKAIADRWIFNTGMTLHYYSSGITIGQQVNTYVQASASFVNPTALSTVPSAAVYSAGDRQSFTNRYYFLELPVNMQWQVNKSHLLPLFLEGGFSLARLMSANALLYDSETGVYSKQGDQINKTQLYMSTAFMAGLPFHGLHVEVGPQVQYGLTPIVDGHSLGDQHFFYAGIKLIVIPGKK